MPLTTDDFVQQSGGTFNGTSGNATLPLATTAGNIIILVLAQSNNIVDPAGFTLIKKNSLVAPVGGMYWKVSTGESSWAIAPSASAVVDWIVYEMQNLDASNPVDMIISGSVSTGTTASLSTGTTPVSGTYDGLILAMHACLDTTSTTPGTWSNHNNGFMEVNEIGGADATRSLGLSVSRVVPALSLATWSCTADKTAPVGQSSMATVVVLTAANAKRAADLLFCTGFEFNTTVGLAVGNGGSRVFDTVTGTPTIGSTGPRSGTYYAELSSTAAAENIFLSISNGVLSLIPVGAQVGRFSFRSPGGLPAGDTILYTVEHSTVGGQSTVIRYVSASQKIGVKVGSGTEVLSDAAISADTWISIDYRVDARTANFTCDWQVTYSDGTNPVPQTQATMASGTANIQHGARLGWTDAVTRTIQFDDWVVSGVLGHYPLGNYKVLLVKVDTSAAFTVNGVTTNWNVMSANGTLAAWDATTARTNVSEFPMVAGASAAGFVQVANSTTAYVEMQMETFDAAAAGGAIRGVRMLPVGWAATTTTATFGFRAWDGVTEHNIVASGPDRNFDNTTTPSWCCAMVKGANRQDWTQAKFDALAFRAGFSGDTSPVIGILWIGAEVAIRIGELYEVTYLPPGFYVHFRQDPDSNGIIAMIVTVPPGTQGATLQWSVSGTPQTPVHVNADAVNPTVHEETIGATDVATITYVELVPD